MRNQVFWRNNNTGISIKSSLAVRCLSQSLQKPWISRNVCFWEADRAESTHKTINSKQEHRAPKAQHLLVVPFPTICFYLFGLELLRKWSLAYLERLRRAMNSCSISRCGKNPSIYKSVFNQKEVANIINRPILSFQVSTDFRNLQVYKCKLHNYMYRYRKYAINRMYILEQIRSWR